MSGQVYCTAAELMSDLDAEGVRQADFARVYDKILAASRWIENNIGAFIPIHGTRRFDGSGDGDVLIHPLLNAETVEVSGVSRDPQNFLYYPLNGLWAYGPYMRMRADACWLEGGASFPRIGGAVEITGTWGMYERSMALGATAANQGISDGVITVDDGGALSPGMVILVEDEQELVTGTVHPDASGTTLASAVGVEDDTLSVADGSLVGIGETIRIGFEQMLVRDIAGDDLSVERGWARTKRVAHLVGAPVLVYRTYRVTRGVNGTKAAAHAGSAIGRYVAPEDIHWLCKQMAGLMLKKADSGFSGKVGSTDTGEVFYMNEFPKGAIDAIRERYFIPII